MPVNPINVISTIARHELRIILRNRWISAYAAVFALLTLAISYFGLAVIEYTGFQGFERTSVSLLNLILYIVPLCSMLAAVQSLTKEGGTTDQLFTEPITRTEIVVGKFLGVSIANILALLIGFGVSGVLIGLKTGMSGIADYLVLVGFTSLLSFVFVALASFTTILLKRTVKAYAAVLVMWFAMVIFFDLLIIGLTFLLPEGYANKVAFFGLFLNPVSASRVSVLILIAGKEVLGVAGAELMRAIGGVSQAVVSLFSSLIVWVVLPMFLSVTVLKKQDL